MSYSVIAHLQYGRCVLASGLSTRAAADQALIALAGRPDLARMADPHGASARVSTLSIEEDPSDTIYAATRNARDAV